MTKPFKTIDEQIEILTSRKLIIKNEDAAKESLMRFGYYEIINGYKNPFLLASDYLIMTNPQKIC
ncbi:hypothetical protein [Vaginisenegalia massiliensis]|uniref:hypothetical protein n=1 Tax=Vaginisenegalia massiliensis TaxID=2058294 RepID=UPI0019D28A43|nr:hypothetical protein [Vaginisenegalia massiliensis]